MILANNLGEAFEKEFVLSVIESIELLELKNLTSDLDTTYSSQLEKAMAICDYVHNLFTHNGDNEPSKIDPLTILNEARAGQSFRCVEYSLLATGLLWAHGIKARPIGLKTADVETREYGAGHVVIEFWCDELGKWVMCDVQAGIMPRLNGEYLSTYELMKAIESDQLVDYIFVDRSSSQLGKYGDMPSYTDWIQYYLYFIDTPLVLDLKDQDLGTQQIVMLIPVGVNPPIMFQNWFEMNALYTTSATNFYQSPRT
jgi:hypothetical protein